MTSSKALDLLHWAMCAVKYRHITMAIETASKVVCCCPGSRWGNMEQVVAWWWHPVASGVALDMLYWAMLSVLLQHAFLAIKMAHNGGAFVFCRPLFLLDIIVAKDHVMVYYNNQQITLLSFTMLILSSCCLGRHRQQWKLFWPLLSPMDEPGFD